MDKEIKNGDRVALANVDEQYMELFTPETKFVPTRVPLMFEAPGREPVRVGWIDIDDVREGNMFTGKFLESGPLVDFLASHDVIDISITHRVTPAVQEEGEE